MTQANARSNDGCTHRPAPARPAGRMTGLLCAITAAILGFSASPAARAQAAKGAQATTPQQTQPWSQRVADVAIERWPNGQFGSQPSRWNYELGTLLDGMDQLWFSTADAKYYRYIQNSMDQLVQPDGSMPTYPIKEYQLDSILLGRQLLLLYGSTLNLRYYKAATTLYQQLQQQPRNPLGGFWHKQIYPNQMWLDGLYMAEPFYADYAATFHHPEAFADITKQFVLIERHTRDPKTGLLYHGWDESKTQHWANKQAGDSSQFWGRGMGWYMMALVDTLPYYPAGDPGRKELIGILNREAAAVVHFQDHSTGAWYEVMNKPGAKGNYLESSASCMFVYALAKGVRRGYLPKSYLAAARRGYAGILDRFVKTGLDGSVTLTQTVKGAGLGGHPYRDGSYAYYVGAKAVSNDPKEVGTFLLAATEMETAANAELGRGKTVVLDAWFNSQTRTDPTGRKVLWHYKWDDLSINGFSLLGHIFRQYGVNTKALPTAPTAAALSSAQIYIIVSPDIPAKNPNPHFMRAADAEQIAQWVKRGGVLMLFENDPGDADIEHMNLLADKFGIHYDSALRNHVVGKDEEAGTIAIAAGGPVFRHAYMVFMKDTCAISVKGPAQPLVAKNGTIMMATAKYGRGTVFATVDPWLYNEYTDGRKLPVLEHANFAAGRDLVRWIVEQVPAK